MGTNPDIIFNDNLLLIPMLVPNGAACVLKPMLTTATQENHMASRHDVVTQLNPANPIRNSQCTTIADFALASTNDSQPIYSQVTTTSAQGISIPYPAQ
jgi:hypothetical protein